MVTCLLTKNLLTKKQLR